MWRKIDHLVAILFPLALSGVTIPLLWGLGDETVEAVDHFLAYDWRASTSTWYLNHATYALSIGSIPLICLLIPAIFRRINTLLVLSNIIFSYGIQILTWYIALNYFTEDHGDYRTIDLPNEWIWNYILVLSAVIPALLLLVGYGFFFRVRKSSIQIIDN